jgi:hypothetical protein
MLELFKVVKSHPIINGAFAKAHNAKCDFSSSSVNTPFPTYNISGSFQWPGPAYDALA